MWDSFFSIGVLSAYYFPELFASYFLSFILFFLSFIGRPAGAFIVGIFGDKMNRKIALSICFLLFLIGNIGIYSYYTPLIAISTVLIGLGLGGGWSSATVLIMESSKNFRSFWASFIQLGVPIGLLLSPLSIYKISFLVEAMIFSILLILSIRIKDVYPGSKIKLKWKGFFKGVLVKMSESSNFYIFATFSLAYLSYLGYTNTVYLITLMAIEEIFLMVFFGYLADILGKKLVSYMGFLAMFVAAFLLAYSAWINLYYGILAAFIIFGIGDSASYAPQGIIIAEIFDPEIRTTMTGLSYQLSAALAGGLTLLILSQLFEYWWAIPLVSGIYTIMSFIGVMKS